MAIKRIIFDVDNTLIPWKEEYTEGLQQAINEFNLAYSKTAIDSLTTTYENTYPKYSIKQFIEHGKKELNIELSEDFIKTWLRNLHNMSEENKEISETLAYLSQKYELVILTNWFKECQEQRLAKARMREYFIEVYGGETCLKPSIESFKQAIGPHKLEECLMIGDDYEKDIIGAINAGLNAIYLTDKEPISNIKTIKEIKELKEIL